MSIIIYVRRDYEIFFFIRYAKVDVVASAPIVPFRETVVLTPKVDMAHEIVETHNQVSIIIIKSKDLSFIIFAYIFLPF